MKSGAARQQPQKSRDSHTLDGPGQGLSKLCSVLVTAAEAMKKWYLIKLTISKHTFSKNFDFLIEGKRITGFVIFLTSMFFIGQNLQAKLDIFMQIPALLQKPSPNLFGFHGMLCINGCNAAHPLDWSWEAGATITAFVGEHSWGAWGGTALTQFGWQSLGDPDTPAQPSQAPLGLGFRRSVLFIRSSWLLHPERGPKWCQPHLRSTAAPFSIPFSPAAPKKAVVSQRTKLCKASSILCTKIMTKFKLCLPGASETRQSCVGVCLCVQTKLRSVLPWVPAAYWRPRPGAACGSVTWFLFPVPPLSS